MNDADVEAILNGTKDWPRLDYRYAEEPDDLVPPSWRFDPWYRDEVVYPRIRGLIHEGYTDAEIGIRMGVTNDTARKIRRQMGMPKPFMVGRPTK